MSNGENGNRGQLFNGAIESAIQTAVLLEAWACRKFNLNELAYLSYGLIHSGEVFGSVESVHGKSPERSSELFLRLQLTRSGLELLTTSSLADLHVEEGGLYYQATEAMSPFLSSFEAPYVSKLRNAARVISEIVPDPTESFLRERILPNLADWSGLSDEVEDL